MNPWTRAARPPRWLRPPSGGTALGASLALCLAFVTLLLPQEAFGQCLEARCDDGLCEALCGECGLCPECQGQLDCGGGANLDLGVGPGEDAGLANDAGGGHDPEISVPDFRPPCDPSLCGDGICQVECGECDPPTCEDCIQLDGFNTNLCDGPGDFDIGACLDGDFRDRAGYPEVDAGAPCNNPACPTIEEFCRIPENFGVGVTACTAGSPCVGDDTNGVAEVCSCEGCGNGLPDGGGDPGEECDDGNIEDGDGCDSDCTISRCGNGIVSTDVDGNDEQCDDGNLEDGDGCDSNCTETRCGNGIVSVDENGDDEVCDDGNNDNGDACDSNCTLPACGNGVVAVDEDGNPEACDDGNTDNHDGCDEDCSESRCGNGIISIDENGDDEVCDDGNDDDGDACVGCQEARCGDGVVQDRIEGCDDGNDDDDDDCDNDCKLSTCGNGDVDEGEECDDGNQDENDGCRNNCLLPCDDGCVCGLLTTVTPKDDRDFKRPAHSSNLT